MAALQPGGIQAAAAAKRQRGVDPVAGACHHAAWKSNNDENLGDAARAKELYERALAIEEAAHGTEHVKVVAPLIDPGYVIDLGDATKAEELFGRSLAIEEAVHGTEHVGVARTLNNLGSTYADLGDAAKAKELLEHALAIKEAAYGPAHVEVANTLGILGDAHPDLGDAVKARELCERALTIQEAAHGPADVKWYALSTPGSAYSDLGDAVSCASESKCASRCVCVKIAAYITKSNNQL